MGSRGPVSSLPVAWRAETGHRKPKNPPKAAPIAPAEPRWADVFPLPAIPGVWLAKDGRAELRRQDVAGAQHLVAEVKRARRDAAATWRLSLAFLDGLGVLGTGDRDALAEYARCRAWEALYTRALAREGGVVKGDKGVLVVHPAARLERQYGAAARALAVQLGLTPAARQRMDVTRPEEPDDLLDPFD